MNRRPVSKGLLPMTVCSTFEQKATDRPAWTAAKLLEMIEAAPPWEPGEPANEESYRDETPIKPEFSSIAELAEKNPHLRPPVIEGLLRRGETMNVISVPKVGKSWLVLDLAISAVAGRMWLGKFPTVQGNVLIIDNELHQQTIANRIPKVAAARGVLLSELSGLFIESLRGRLRDIYAMDSYFRAIEPGRFKIIILDAFYRFLPRESDENSNADLASIYNAIDRYADFLGCCFVCIHHSSKGVQAGKAVTDVGSGAGAQSRAVDSHLILRHHRDEGAVVLEAAVRSWPPVQPFCLRWDFPVWQLADDLNPDDLRKEGRRNRQAEAERPEESAIVWTPTKFAETFVTAEPKDQALILARATIGENALSDRKAQQLLRLAESDALAYRWEPARKTLPVRYATIPQPVTDTGGAK
jgi:hypothetical protein